MLYNILYFISFGESSTLFILVKYDFTMWRLWLEL